MLRIWTIWYNYCIVTAYKIISLIAATSFCMQSPRAYVFAEDSLPLSQIKTKFGHRHFIFDILIENLNEQWIKMFLVKILFLKSLFTIWYTITLIQINLFIIVNGFKLHLGIPKIIMKVKIYRHDIEQVQVNSSCVRVSL